MTIKNYIISPVLWCLIALTCHLSACQANKTSVKTKASTDKSYNCITSTFDSDTLVRGMNNKIYTEVDSGYVDVQFQCAGCASLKKVDDYYIITVGEDSTVHCKIYGHRKNEDFEELCSKVFFVVEN